jgi:hypothetical protein
MYLRAEKLVLALGSKASLKVYGGYTRNVPRLVMRRARCSKLQSYCRS